MLSTAVGTFLERVAGEDVGVLLDGVAAALHQRDGQGHEFSDEVEHDAAGAEAALVRRRDEHHRLHERQRLEEHPGLQQLVRRGRDLQGRQWHLADVVPEAGPAVADHEPGQEAPLAVADQHHLAQGRIPVLRVDVLQHMLERVAQLLGREQDWAARPMKGSRLENVRPLLSGLENLPCMCADLASSFTSLKPTRPKRYAQ